MNVHGTHASADLTARVGAHGTPSKTNSDCHIQAAEFSRMLTHLMDKAAEPAADGAGAADAPAPAVVKSDR